MPKAKSPQRLSFDQIAVELKTAPGFQRDDSSEDLPRFYLAHESNGFRLNIQMSEDSEPHQLAVILEQANESLDLETHGAKKLRSYQWGGDGWYVKSSADSPKDGPCTPTSIAHFIVTKLALTSLS